MATVVKAIFSVTHDTTANWEKYPKFVPNDGELIVYTDMEIVVDENGKETVIPGLKVGDGNAFLSDLPFIGTKMAKNFYNTEQILEALQAHEADAGIHVTSAEKDRWNAKLNFEVDGETLIFTRD